MSRSMHAAEVVYERITPEDVRELKLFVKSSNDRMSRGLSIRCSTPGCHQNVTYKALRQLEDRCKKCRPMICDHCNARCSNDEDEYQACYSLCVRCVEDLRRCQLLDW